MNCDKAITITQDFDVPCHVLWQYLTQLHHMQAWFFEELEAFDPSIGFTTQFAFDYQGKTFTHCWDVRDVIDGKLLALGWKYREYSGDSVALFTLKESAGGCRLCLEATIVEPFPALEEFSLESMKAGWTGLLQDRLKNYVQ